MLIESSSHSASHSTAQPLPPSQRRREGGGCEREEGSGFDAFVLVSTMDSTFGQLVGLLRDGDGGTAAPVLSERSSQGRAVNTLPSAHTDVYVSKHVG